MKNDFIRGCNTITGLNFEIKVDFQTLLARIPGYSITKISGIAGTGLFFNGDLVARCFKKYDFCKFLEESNIDWRKMLSRKLLPDDAIEAMNQRTLFIIEAFDVNFYECDDELLLCDFKRKQYQKLVASLGLKVEYVYVLNDWFRKPEYKDVLDYINSVNCHYKFNELPLAWLGLSVPRT